MDEQLPNYDDFEDSLVAFIDLLGFDHRVRAIQKKEDFFEVGKLLYATKATADALDNSEDLLKNFKFTAISDSIIVSVPFKDPICTVGLLHILHNIQYELVATAFKTIIRGYINRGRVYHKNGLIFGEGYSGAYKGEKMIGSAPRIVLSPEVVKDARRVIDNYRGKKKMITALDFLREDKSDGFHFIDYLKPVGTLAASPEDQLIEERRQIAQFIEEELSRFESDWSVLPKYKWLNNYFHESARYFREE